MLDLNHELCPDGTFTWTVNGIQVRSDGVHLTPDGVRWLTSWLVRALTGGAVKRLGSAAQMSVGRLDVWVSVADLAVVVEDAVGSPVSLAGRAGQDVAVRQSFDGYFDEPGVRCREDLAIPGAADEDRV